MAFYPGRAASILIGGTAKPLESIDFTPKAEVISVANFTSNGWEENEAGLKQVEIAASGPYNGISTGAVASDSVGTSVAFVVNMGNGAMTVTARISEEPIVTDVHGVSKISYRALSNGAPTIVY